MGSCFGAARRARANVEQLVALLPEIGYAFEREPFTPPPRDVADRLDALEERIGVLPLSLRTWFEEVGEVSLVGTHPGGDVTYPDPLEVAAPVEYILNEFGAWEDVLGTEHQRGTFFEVPSRPTICTRPTSRSRTRRCPGSRGTGRASRCRRTLSRWPGGCSPCDRRSNP